MKAQLRRSNGILKIDINGKLYQPLSFKSFRPNPCNVSEFYRAGVRLFSILSSGITSALGVPYSLYGESWNGENTYDFSAIDRQIEMFMENAPEGYFALMLQLDTRDWYLEQHPGVPNSFTHLSQIAHDEEWKMAAAEYMKAAIRHCEEKYGERIYGYFLLGGTTTEWFSEYDYERSHPIKEAGYRKWRRNENVSLPGPERLNQTGEVFLMEEEEDVYLARKFHSESIANLILYFAGQARSVLQHRKLLGVYYGYLFELGGERLFNDGCLGYEKVFESPDIDMISSPSAYGYRKLTDTSAFMVTQKTLDAHNKLYFLEFDHITHVAPTMVDDGMAEGASNRKLCKIPGADSKCRNEAESLNLMWRDFILCNANMTALWWFDMFDGWFRSKGMMDAVSRMIRISEFLSGKETESAAQIAVFAEGESMYRVRKSSKLASLCLSDIRRTLAECGAAYDLYSIGDITLAQIDRYKLYLFVNQYDMTEQTKKQITERLEKAGKTVLWLYAPDYAHHGKLSVHHISDMVGMNVEKSSTSHGAVCFEGESVQYDLAAPYFSIQDESVSPIARFEDGETAAAYKEENGFKSVYVAACNLSSGLLRTIAELAGVTVYSYDNRVYVYPNSVSMGIYNASKADAVIHIKEDGIYRDLIKGQRFECKEGRLVIPRGEINAFLLVKECEIGRRNK